MKRGNSKKKNDVVFILFSLVLGMLMGWLSRDLQGTGAVGAIISNLGLWVSVSALLAFYTPQAFQAALHVFVYFAGVISAYFSHHLLLGGTVEMHTLIYWGILSVIGSLIGWIDWHAGSREWIGAAACAVPVSLLLAEGYPVYQSRSVSLAFDIICAAVLYLVLAPGKMQKLMTLPFIIVFTFALVYFDVLSGVFGGWI